MTPRRPPRWTLLLCLGAVLLVGARPLRGQGVDSASRASDSSAVEVVRAYLTAYNAHDVEAVIARLAPDFVWLSIVGDSVVVEARGHAALRAQLTDYFRAFPTARSQLEEISALGPWVSARERAHWVGAAGPRSQASLSVYEVRAGRLRRVWYYPVVREDGAAAGRGNERTP